MSSKSTSIPNAIIDDSRLNVYERAVVTEIIKRNQERNQSMSPYALEEFQGKLSISKHTVISSIKGLESKGVIRVSRDNGWTTSKIGVNTD